MSTSSDQQHVCICKHVHLATIPHNTLLESDIMIKGCSNPVKNELTHRRGVMEWTWDWSLSVCSVGWYCKTCPTHIRDRKWNIFPFSPTPISMTFISIITAILSIIVISSSQQDSLQIKAFAGEWWIPSSMLGLLTPEGKITLCLSLRGLKYLEKAIHLRRKKEHWEYVCCIVKLHIGDL